MSILFKDNIVTCLTEVIETISIKNKIKLDITYNVKNNKTIIEYFINRDNSSVHFVTPLPSEFSQEDKNKLSVAICGAINKQHPQKHVSYNLVVECCKQPRFNIDKITVLSNGYSMLVI